MSELLNINKKISYAKTKIKFFHVKIYMQTKLKVKEALEKRKARAHLLITKGVLLEMLGLENEDNEVILGFLSTFPKNNNEKEHFKSIGKEIFKNYKKTIK